MTQGTRDGGANKSAKHLEGSSREVEECQGVVSSVSQSSDHLTNHTLACLHGQHWPEDHHAQRVKLSPIFTYNILKGEH